MTAPKKNLTWVWYFAFLLVASVGVAGVMIWFNLSIQLTPEQLDAAWKRWKEHGPRNYRLTYTKQITNNDHEATDELVATVQDGRAWEVFLNGARLLDDEGHVITPGDERLQYHTMNALFRDVDRFLELDAKENRKTYTVAGFDKETGALVRYIRRVMGTRQRLELDVKVQPLPQQ
jgi:hypothetical protein